MADDLDVIAAELLALTPGEFTAARNTRAAASGDLRQRVKALRKPSVPAWAVDLLVTQAPDEFAEALRLAELLRAAQHEMDGAELAALGSQRRRLVAALARHATSLAAERGVAVSAAAEEEVARTVNAAVMDAAAAAAVATGRLIRTLEATGLESADLADAVAGSLPGAPAPEAVDVDDLSERRARKAAEKAARDADRAATEAERDLARVDARRQKAADRAELLADRASSLRRDLERVERDLENAGDEVERLTAERVAAAAAARRARSDAEAAGSTRSRAVD